MRKLSLMLPIAVFASMNLAASLALPASAAVTAGLSGQAAVTTVRGTVTTGGKADAGVKVLIHAWPDQAVVQALKPGQEVPWVLVGRARTDASGRYSVSLPLAKLMPEASYGVVNLEADTSSAGDTFPVAVTKNTGNAYLAGSRSVVNLAGKPHGLPLCGFGNWNYTKSLGKHWATVGETYVPSNQAKQQFTYDRGQSSTIGAGTSASGTNGSFADDGSYSWSSSLKEAWPTFGARRSVWYRTEFHFGEYRCSTSRTYLQHVNGYAGGAHIEKPTSVPHTPSRFCVGQMSGSTPSSNNSAAVTWTRSLGIHAGLDFHASVETGFDSSAEVTYTFTRTGSLCGWKDNPGGVPKQLVVH
jgi:hypothetical protein